MNIAQYTFQSPYPSPVQIGRLDPSSLKDSSSSQSDTSSLLKASNETLKKAQVLETSLKSEVKPSVSQSKSLDIYA
ncbi:hypothetical protein [Sulfurimonas sp. NWX367]|uniref:hypothetical protein n=1 Tax=unclassified Sulfurimonas TaxID=2623549 RepID=UPI003204D67B